MKCFWKTGCSDKMRCTKRGSCVAAYQNEHKDELFATRTRDDDDIRQYRDIDGNPVTLRRLIKLEPEWARSRLAVLERERDYAIEAHRLLKTDITNLQKELTLFKAACDLGKLDHKALDTLLLERHKQ